MSQESDFSLVPYGDDTMYGPVVALDAAVRVETLTALGVSDEIAQHIAYDMDEQRSPEQLRAWAQDPSSYVMTAMEGEELAGWCLAQRGGHEEPDSPRANRIDRVAVAPASRRKGVASALVRTFLTQVADPTLPTVLSAEKDAVPFWAALGFAVTGSYIEGVGGAEVESFHMARKAEV